MNMKKLRVMILTLVLSVSMLAPEFSMLPAAYAEDGTTAVEQSVDGGAAAGTQDSEAGSAAEGGDASQTVDQGDASGPAEPSTVDENAALDEGTDEASDDGASDPAINEGEAADPADEGEPQADVTSEDTAEGDPVSSAEGEDPAEGEENPEDPAEPAVPVEIDAYSKIQLTDLDDKGGLLIPDELKEKITTEHTQYGNGVLVNGTVADLNALRLTINGDFDFDKGSAGRLTFDGLKDKDSGMAVEVQLYLDDEEEPVSSFPLSKQMGKKDWANRGDKTVRLGSREITGKHKVSLGLKITGKKDTASTSVSLRSLQFCITTIPVMYFNIDETEGTIEAMNNSGDHSIECYGTVDLIVPESFNNDTTFRDEYGEQESLTGLKLEYIRGRGNSTWDTEKKPYKVKLDKAKDLFGFGKNKHWILLANRFDNSLVRNRMTYWLGQQLGMEYTPQCVPVEVVMNGEYYGSYLLCEQIRIGEGRVEIDDLDKNNDSPEITEEVKQTGGYLLSLDYEEDEQRYFTTKGGASFFIESPEDNVDQYRDYIKAFTQKAEDAIISENFRDAADHPYTDYLDMDAAVDYWWIQEFSANGDAYGSGSTYLYKKRDNDTGAGKLFWGPLWDFDYVAWGDLEYDSEAPDNLDYTTHPWFTAMKSDPEFVTRVRKRWSEEGGLKYQIDEITKKGGLLDRYIDQMETSYNYDHELYGAYDSDLTEYKAEVEQLRAWILDREAKVDAAVKELNVDPHKVKFMADGKTVKEITVVGVLKESDIPKAPAKTGKVFTGWFTKDFTCYEAGSRVTKDIVLYAEYVDKSNVVKAKNIYFKNYDVYYIAFFDYYGEEDWYKPDYMVMPENAWDQRVTWSSSNEEVAKPDGSDGFRLLDFGDATLTATLSNGVKRSMKLHVVPYDKMDFCEEISLATTSITLKPNAYKQIRVKLEPSNCEMPELIWISTNENVASVDDFGIVTANKVGTAQILAIDSSTRQVYRCKVTVKSPNIGKTIKRNGNTYKITSDTKGKRRCRFVKAKNAASVTIPAYIKYNGKKYYVNKIQEKAFAKSKAKTVTIRTKKLTKKSVKKALAKSKVKTIRIKVGKAKVNKTYIKKYKKFFTKKNAGRAVKLQ